MLAQPSEMSEHRYQMHAGAVMLRMLQSHQHQCCYVSVAREAAELQLRKLCQTKKAELAARMHRGFAGVLCAKARRQRDAGRRANML